MIVLKVPKCVTHCLLVVLLFGSNGLSDGPPYPSKALDFSAVADAEGALLSSFYHDAPGGRLYLMDSSTNGSLRELRGLAALGGEARLGWALAMNQRHVFVSLDSAEGKAGEVLVLDRRAPSKLAARLVSPRKAPDDRFGRSLATAQRHLAVAAGGGAGGGEVYCYDVQDAKITFAQRLVPNSGERPAGFGKSLSMTDDALLVGAPAASGGNAFLYARLENRWHGVSDLGAVLESARQPYSRLGDHVEIRRGVAVVSGWSGLFLFDLESPSVRLAETLTHLSRKGRPMRVVDLSFSGTELAALFTARGEDVLVVWRLDRGEWTRSFVRSLPDPYRTDFAVAIADGRMLVAGSDMYAYGSRAPASMKAAVSFCAFEAASMNERTFTLRHDGVFRESSGRMLSADGLPTVSSPTE